MRNARRVLLVKCVACAIHQFMSCTHQNSGGSGAVADPDTAWLDICGKRAIPRACQSSFSTLCIY